MNRAVAFLADVHGNALALDAVLAAIERRGVREIVNLGDNANGPLEPARSVALLRARVRVHVRGNGDRLTGTGGETGSTRFAAAKLHEAERTWLGALPLTACGDGWFACHGSPTDDTFYLVESVGPHGVALRPTAEIAAALADVSERVIVCGHTHVPRIVQLADGRLVVNPGSVGLQAYEDATPFPHAMEAGSPHARFALVHFGAGGAVDVELCAVAYDWETAARQAETQGFAAWAPLLRTGRVAERPR